MENLSNNSKAEKHGFFAPEKMKTRRDRFKKKLQIKFANLTTTVMIDDFDPNKEIFSKFSFSSTKHIYAMMAKFNDHINVRKFEKTRLFLLSPTGFLATLFFLLIICCGIIIPFFSQDPTIINPNKAFLDFGVDGHILGTDSLGRDVFARVFWGLRNSIGIAAVAVIMDLILGIAFGLLMGYFRFFDRLFSFFIKILTIIPSTIILILVALVLSASVGSIILGIMITGWIGMALQVRGYIKSYSQREFVFASKMLGTPTYKIIYGLIPFIMGNIFANLIITIPGAILADTYLSFLGILVPNLPTLGSAMNAARIVISTYPQQLLGPVLIITITLFDVRLISVTLNDIFRSSR